MTDPIRRKFTCALWILQDATVYLLPDNRLAFRSTCRKREPNALPIGAIFVGRYRHPFPSDQFLSDVSAILARNNRRAA